MSRAYGSSPDAHGRGGPDDVTLGNAKALAGHPDQGFPEVELMTAYSNTELPVEELHQALASLQEG